MINELVCDCRWKDEKTPGKNSSNISDLKSQFHLHNFTVKNNNNRPFNKSSQHTEESVCVESTEARTTTIWKTKRTELIGCSPVCRGRGEATYHTHTHTVYGLIGTKGSILHPSLPCTVISLLGIWHYHFAWFYTRLVCVFLASSYPLSLSLSRSLPFSLPAGIFVFSVAQRLYTYACVCMIFFLGSESVCTTLSRIKT